MAKKPVDVLARLDGLLYEVSVGAGDKVSEGDTLFTIEAAKSLLKVGAPYDGIVKEVMRDPGDDVSSSDCIIELERFISRN